MGLSLCALGSDAQTFARSYGNAGTSEGGDVVIVSPDGDFFVGGYQSDSALIMKVDPVGTVLWARTFKSDSPYSDVVIQLAITPDNKLIGCGNAVGGDPLLTRTNFFFKLELDGTVDWIKASSDNRPILAYSILPRSVSEYVLVDEVYDMASPSFADPMSQGISAADGSVLWTSPRYDYVPTNPYIDDIYASALGNGPFHYSTGRTYLSGSAPGSMRAFITKSDGAGNLVFSRYYITSAADEARVYGTDILYVDDSLTISYTGDIDQYSSIFRIGLIHTDSTGVVAWARYYDISDFASELAFKALKMPYGYALAGYGVGGTHDLFVLAVTEQGHLLWAKGFGSSADDEDIGFIYSKLAASTGSDILLTGRRVSGGASDLLLYRMDLSGSIDCGEGFDLNVVESDAPTFVADLAPVSLNETILHQSLSAVDWSAISESCSLAPDLLGNDTAACASVLLDASGSGASTYLWQDGSTNASLTASTPGIYWVQVSLGCCVAVDSVIVSSTTAPLASFIPQVDPCQFDVTFENTSTNADQFAWQFGDGSTSSAEQPTNMYDSTGTYTVLLIASNGCGADTASQDVTITAQASLTLFGPDSLCANEEALYAITLDGANILSSQWSTGEMDTDSVLFSASSSAEVSVDVTGDNGCTYSSTIDVSITPPPAADFTFVTVDCGSTVEFTDASSGALDWSWQFGNGSGSSSPSPTAEYEEPGTFDAELVVSNACGSDTVTQQLDLGPTGNISINGPSVLCPDSVGTFSVVLDGTAVTSVDWSNGGDDPVAQFSTPDDTDLFVSVTGDDGCTYADTLAISVLPLPQAGFTTAQSPCDSVVQFINGSLNALAWQWDLGNGESSALSDPVASYPLPGTYTAMLIVSGECGSDTTSQSIGIGALGTLSLLGPATICDNEEVSYSAVLAGGGTAQVLWSTGDTTSTIVLSVSGDQLLTATVVGDDGCVYVAALAVHVIGMDGEAATYVPNVFTPNGDGLNELFGPVFSDPDGFREMLIFNRWGEEIYATTSLQAPWDGRRDNEPVPDGTYVYIVRWKDRCTGVKQEEHGHVTLLR